MTLINSRSLRGRCAVCGVAHAGCGPPSESVPFDQRVEVAVMGGPLKEYEVELPGGRKATMKLNEADAERYGVGGSGEQQEQAEAPAGDASAKSRPAARNKARTTSSDKGDG